MNNNYELIKEEYIKDIDSNLCLLKHKKSGARVCLIKNDDDNKVFSITFRTPPINNCGLTHILEHSVLCGSKKYPVKDPFVEMLKKSMNTFLNAFTFPDKTMYPIASKNNKDFCNLMDIYMDAVLNPNIYNHKEIFMQEGWHYDIDSKDSDIKINGVVYNEMKGAFSNPNDVLQREIMHSLFKDSQYGLESGGDPKYIPDLSYEEFLDFHSKYYHPSNSYIQLYGNLDFDERLDYLDKEYLSKYDKIDFDTRIKYQNPYSIKEVSYYPSNETADATFLSYNFALNSTLDIKECIATQILTDHLLGLPGSPLFDKLIEANIAKDISYSFDDSILQPFISIQAIGSNYDSLDKFINIIDEKLKELVTNGLDHDAILSLINNAEFRAREAYFTRFPKGLTIQINLMSSFLYNDDMPFDKLSNIKYYAELKEDIKEGYFEKLIEKLFINNNHKSIVSLIPDNNMALNSENELKEKLKKFKASLSNDEILKLVDDKKNLLAYQEEESRIEDIKKLPTLKLEDISIEPEKLNLEVFDKKFKILYSNYNTNGIIYANYYISIDDIDISLLQYLSLYTDLVTYLNTKKHSYKDLNNIILNETGGISVGIYVTSVENGGSKSYILASYSALKDKAALASNLLDEVIFETEFDDKKRIKERLEQIKTNLEMSISDKGHSVSMIRSLSRISEICYAKDAISGLMYLDFIKDLLDNFDNKIDEIISNLKETLRLYSKKNFIFGLTCEENDCKIALDALLPFYNKLFDCANYTKFEFKESVKKEAILTDYDVNFNALSGKYSMPYNGAMTLISNIISMDYLWMNVRVKSGAYGCFISITRNGYITFASYRDPKIKETYDTYKNIHDYIKDLSNLSDEELLDYKIGTFGNLQQVLHNKNKGDLAQKNYISGITYDISLRQREEILNCKKEDLVNLLNAFMEAISYDNICTIGKRSQIEDNKDLFDTFKEI